ncbi:MAG: hypothetical protein LW595_06460 [Rickettsiales bacterium]|nr:hypothetical protein [Rickettsiales bacterium]
MIQEFIFFSAYFRFIIFAVALFGAVPLTYAIFYKIMFDYKSQEGFKIFLYAISNALIFIAIYAIIHYLTFSAFDLAYNELGQSLAKINNLK